MELEEVKKKKKKDGSKNEKEGRKGKKLSLSLHYGSGLLGHTLS